MGLTLPPSFPEQPWLYVYATRKVKGIADQILRIKMNGTEGTEMQLVRTVQQAGSGTTAGVCCSGPTGCCPSSSARRSSRSSPRTCP